MLLHWQGYHKIESLLYRDSDVQTAGIYADELVRDSEDLVKAFQDKTLFNASRTFDGIIDVATEIGAHLHISTNAAECLWNTAKNIEQTLDMVSCSAERSMFPSVEWY